MLDAYDASKKANSENPISEKYFFELLSDILSVTGSGLKINFFIGFLSRFYLRGITLLPPPTDEQSFMRGKRGSAKITVTTNSGIIIYRIS